MPPGDLVSRLGAMLARYQAIIDTDGELTQYLLLLIINLQNSDFDNI